jgi:hypothetical protein
MHLLIKVKNLGGGLGGHRACGMTIAHKSEIPRGY